MIIRNGEIRFAKGAGTGGGIDPETGYPLKPEKSFGEPKPCQVVPRSINYLGRTREDGLYLQASYEILLEERDDEPGAERVMVRTEDGLPEWREFSLISREPLRAVEQSRLLV